MQVTLSDEGLQVSLQKVLGCRNWARFNVGVGSHARTALAITSNSDQHPLSHYRSPGQGRGREDQAVNAVAFGQLTDHLLSKGIVSGAAGAGGRGWDGHGRVASRIRGEFGIKEVR